MKLLVICFLICLSINAETPTKASLNIKLSQPELESVAQKLKLAEQKLKSLDASTTIQVEKTAATTQVKIETPPEVTTTETIPVLPAKVTITQTAPSDEELRRIKSENSKLKSEIANLKNAVAGTTNTKELKDRLAMAELEVERLSDLLNQRREDVLAGRKPAKIVEPARVVANPLITEKQAEKTESDMQTLTVMADKVFLRINPGKDASPLMAVTKGNKLVVEKRVGEWYRVIAPNGTRAWISSDVVAFGGTPNSAPTTTVKVGGYNSELEDEAFKTIMGMSTNK